MSITREEVQKIAHLARVGVPEEDLDKTAKELGGILDFVDRLQKVDTNGVPEAAAPAIEADAFRKDEAIACTDDERGLIMDNFPAEQSGMLKAPAVFDKPKH